MEKVVLKFIGTYEEKNKKRFTLMDLQAYLVKHFKGEQSFREKGGYLELYDIMQRLTNDNRIKAIAASPYNGLNPTLKTKWQIINKGDLSGFDPALMLRYADLLDFTYYRNNPSYQTEAEWAYIENIYQFLSKGDQREWVSVEERSLELFADEKFLTGRKDILKGKHGILSRLKLSYEDLKMIRYGEMFVYWQGKMGEIKNVIILENHSTFFSFKRIMEKQGNILGLTPDMLIYGEGKKIENSLGFLAEMTDLSKVKIFYFGDFDSEGLAIYYRLRARYADLDISLQVTAYKLLIEKCQQVYPLGKQKKDDLLFEYFKQDMEEYLSSEELRCYKVIWDEDRRIPQELINYESLLQVKM